MSEAAPYRSYSQLEEWMKCGESYRLRRRVGIKEQPSVWLPAGSAFHSVTELIDTAGPSEDEVRQAWLDLFYEQIEEQRAKCDPQYTDTSTWKAAGKGKETIPWWREQGATWAIDYLRWRERSGLQVYEHDGAPVMETQLMPVLDGVAIKMFPDRIMVDGNGQLLVMDIKTGSRDIPHSLQLGVYKVGVEKLLGVPVEWGAWYQARKGELSLPVPLLQWTEDRVSALFSMFDQQEKAGQYLPRVGEHCKYMCSVREWCVYQGGKRHPEDGA